MRLLKDIYSSTLDKELFLKGLICIINADAEQQKSELELLNYIAVNIEYQNNVNDLISESFDIDKFQFDSDEQKEIFLEQAIKMSLIDNDFHPNEEQCIRKMSENFSWTTIQIDNLIEKLKKYDWIEQRDLGNID